MTVPDRPPAPPPPAPPPHGAGEPAHDPWLQQALRHAPDAELQPPAALREAILREAAQALGRPPVSAPASSAVAALVAAVQAVWRGLGHPAGRWAGAAALVLLVVWAGWLGSSPRPPAQVAMQAGRAPESRQAEATAAQRTAATRPDAAPPAPGASEASFVLARPDRAEAAPGGRARPEPDPQSPVRVAAAPPRAPGAPTPAGRPAAPSADAAAAERASAADARSDIPSGVASGVAVAIAPAGAAAPAAAAAPVTAPATSPGVAPAVAPALTPAAGPPEVVAVAPGPAAPAAAPPAASPARRSTELSRSSAAAAAAEAGSADARVLAAAPQPPALTSNALNAAARPRAVVPEPVAVLRLWARDPQLQWRTRGEAAAAGPAQRAWLERLAAAGGNRWQVRASGSAAETDPVELWLIPAGATPVSIRLDGAAARVTMRQGVSLWSADLPGPEGAALLEAVRGW